MAYDIPAAGSRGPVPEHWEPLPLGKAVLRREGTDITLVSVGAGVHRCLEAAEILQQERVTSCVLDLRSVSPLDRETIRAAAAATGRLVVVDEDYQNFGLSGEVAATLLEADVGVQFRRVCTQGTIPYARHREDEVLPSTARIVKAVRSILV